MPDQTLNCVECHQDFLFSEKEAKFYEEKQFTPPKRCKPCREAKKARQQAGGKR